MRESAYQRHVIKEIQRMFPHAIVLKNDPSYRQGIPDLLILERHLWAALEVKASENAPVQPNQPYYVDLMNRMAFAAFIYPAVEHEVFNELQNAFNFNG